MSISLSLRFNCLFIHLMKKTGIRLPIAGMITFAATSLVTAQNNDAATDAKIDALIKKLIKKMTLEEKISMLHANGIFTTGNVPRLSIPSLTMDDGPLGVREDLSPNGGWASANFTT